MARTKENEEFERSSFLFGLNAPYIEALFDQFQKDPSGLDPEWREFFESMGGQVLGNENGAASQNNLSRENGSYQPSWAKNAAPLAHEDEELIAAFDGNWPGQQPQAAAYYQPAPQPNTPQNVLTRPVAGIMPKEPPSADKQAITDSVRALMLIRLYRVRGHLIADLDPLKLTHLEEHPELDPAHYGFRPEDWDREIYLDNVLGMEKATLRQIMEVLKRTYCRKIGVEFMHISEPEEKSWIQERIEGVDKHIQFTPEGKKAILNKLIEAEGFEKFLAKKYVGTKRFGLEGGESALPALEQIIKRGGQLGLRDIILGMPHRGRLNVLTNVMGKPARAIFSEFKGGASKPETVEGSGDVKYHLGASSDRAFDGNNVHLSLTANPSHLEIVDPVVLGKARAKQDHLHEKHREKVLPLLLHGDAAFAGQGVVAECFGLSGLTGHRTGGSIHFIINNQIGFTTAPHYSRSSPYPSDVAKMVGAPIFHVNGDDPESVVYVAKIATEFRQRFAKPVVIDMVCYRRHGHNEGDEPSFTQPEMYKEIRSHKTVVDIYAQQLLEEGVVSQAEIDEMTAINTARLDGEFEAGNDYTPDKADWLDGRWSKITLAEEGPRRGHTEVSAEKLKEIGLKFTAIPDHINVHRTLDRLIKKRREMVETGTGIDWAMAEHLAFGSLLEEGYPVRLSGQDCERGTFSQRHSVINDQVTGDKYTPLQHLSKKQAPFEVINSMLSEEAVLGFEYGYSLAEPNSLTMWEAQFGDFANGAQVVVDQFISSSERKWLRMSGLVMLLPHGYEGQGPEHSSARLERYLQLCAEDNMQVANCTTPANYFHILRRQLMRNFRKPLILMTPKSLLRHKRVTSKISELAEGSSFHRILWDDVEFLKDQKIKLAPDNEIKRVILCSGKVYYDLYEEREKRGINDMYILRIEELYPFPAQALSKELSRFKQADICWCQEEPKNMGAWTYIESNIEWVLDHIHARIRRPVYAGRDASASTAAGRLSSHQKQLKKLLDDAFSLSHTRKWG